MIGSGKNMEKPLSHFGLNWIDLIWKPLFSLILRLKSKAWWMSCLSWQHTDTCKSRCVIVHFIRDVKLLGYPSPQVGVGMDAGPVHIPHLFLPTVLGKCSMQGLSTLLINNLLWQGLVTENYIRITNEDRYAWCSFHFADIQPSFIWSSPGSWSHAGFWACTVHVVVEVEEKEESRREGEAGRAAAQVVPSGNLSSWLISYY